jgi:hypothetical protein
MMRVGAVVVMMLVATLPAGSAVGAGERECWLFEVEGGASLQTLGGTVVVTAGEELSCNVLPWLQVGIGGRQRYRNHSVSLGQFVAVSYRFASGRIAVPLGPVGGFELLRVGGYREVHGAVGGGTGLFYSLTPRASLRLRYRLTRHFTERRMWDNTVLIGLGMGFGGGDADHRFSNPAGR